MSKFSLFSCFVLVAGLFYLSGCRSKSGADGLIIQGASIEGEIPRESNLTFYLNANLAPDSIFEQWQKTAYVRFDPPIEGQFRWTGANTLEFSPARPWAPATSYQATLDESVRQFKPDAPALEPDHSWNFYTPDPVMQGVRLFWTRPPGSSAPWLRADLSFNYPVNGEQVSRLLVPANLIGVCDLHCSPPANG